MQLLQARCSAADSKVEGVVLFSRDVDITMLVAGCNTIYKISLPQDRFWNNETQIGLLDFMIRFYERFR
jgi:hypothetical protein